MMYRGGEKQWIGRRGRGSISDSRRMAKTVVMESAV